MAAPAPNRTEIGIRVRTVREMANLSARRLRIALGSSDSNLVSDIEEGRKKIVDFLRLKDIAEVCAGKGQLEGVKWEEILDYITCRIEWDIRPRPNTRLVADDQPDEGRELRGRDSNPQPSVFKPAAKAA